MIRRDFSLLIKLKKTVASVSVFDLTKKRKGNIEIII